MRGSSRAPSALPKSAAAPPVAGGADFTGQDQAGNAFLQDQMREAPPCDLGGGGRIDDALKRAAFLAGGPYVDWVHTDDTWMFEAAYSPKAEVFTASVDVAVQFADGVEAAKAKGLVKTPADEAAYRWKDAEKAQWMKDLEADVEGFWSGRYGFHVDRPRWEEIGADVVVDIDPYEATEKARPEDYALGALKTDKQDFQSLAGTRQSVFSSTINLGSNDVGSKPGVVKRIVAFESDGSLSDPDMASFAKELGGGTPMRPVRLDVELRVPTGQRALGQTADANLRAAAAKVGLSGAGTVWNTTILDVTNGDVYASVSSDVPRGHDTAAHEFGHVFGLGDEYVEKDPKKGEKKPGDAVTHGDEAAGMPTTGGAEPTPTVADDARVMSKGNLVLPEHYATFHEAIESVTGLDWMLGPATAPKAATPPKVP